MLSISTGSQPVYPWFDSMFANVGFKQREVVRFVYENKEDQETYSKSYNKDSLWNRTDFVEHLREQGFLYNEGDVMLFLSFKDTKQLFKEVI